MKRQTGIWLDLRDAWIIKLPVEKSGEVDVTHISSEIEEGAAVGGTRSKAPWGPQHGNEQKRLEERRHHGEKHYFSEVIKQLDPATEELVIFGPSEAKHGLVNLLAEQYRGPKIAGVESADQMTEPQKVAWVREFFDRAAPRKTNKFSSD